MMASTDSTLIKAFRKLTIKEGIGLVMWRD